MRYALWLSCIIVAGCAGGPDLDESRVTSYSTWDPEQGRHILGSFPDTLASAPYFRVSVTPVNQPAFQLSVKPAGTNGANGAQLVATSGSAPPHEEADPWFVGLVMDDGTGRQLKIRGVAPGANATIYNLDYRPTSGAPWSDYCGGMGGAIALAGSYSAARIHQSGPWISFACEDGAAHKCNRWGYVAGNAGVGEINWDHHQACTAMANADYCRTGVSYTREETPILIRDFVERYASPAPDDHVHPDTYPGNPDTYYFEAGWRPGSLAPVCLSRLRWAGLAPDPCPDVLPDPRFTPGARYCEDMPIEELQRLGVFLVNASKTMDAPLRRWRNVATGDVVTTLRGYADDVDGDGAADFQRAPFDGYLEYQGTDSLLLRNLPGSLDASVMIRLYMQYDPVTGDRTIAHAPLPGHLVDLSADFEAYAFRYHDTVPGLLPLSLCRIGADYRATVAPPPDCTDVTPLGYALPPL